MKTEIELSIVIPTLNEEQTILRTVENLSAQKDLQLEVIISDGGSTDATCREALKSRLVVSTVTGMAGKAAQLNAGAATAQGEFILFLHADSSFSENRALKNGIDALRTRYERSGGRPSAGHFRLKFDRIFKSSSLAFSFHESKARVERDGCSHGDQGILISAGHFRQTGGFDAQCHILSETLFADRLRRNGEWLLLPEEIITSARRFENEGMKERQALNAIIMGLAFAGKYDLLAKIPELYRNDHQRSKMGFGRLFDRVKEMIDELPEHDQSAFWGEIGLYLGNNAWQFALLMDEILRYCRIGRESNQENRILSLYEKHLEKACNSRFSAKLASTLSRSCADTVSLLLRGQKR